MLERIGKLFTENKNREAFFKIVGRHWPMGSAEYRLIEKAYDAAKNAFRHTNREGGERYFEHLRGVALIILEHLRCRDHEVIIASLLHDIVEDRPEWTHERVSFEFSQSISELVWWVTKPPVSDYDDDKEARNRAYHNNLGRAPRKALIVKLADRLHNLMTLWDCTPEKRLRKVLETQDYYLHLAEKEMLLIHEIEDALRKLLA